MTKMQRRMIWKWCVAAALLLPFIILDDYIAANASWIRWVVFPLLVLAPVLEPVSLRQREEGRRNFNHWVDEMPWLKVWAGICAAICFGGAIYVAKSPYRLEEVFGFKIVVIAFVVLLAPILVATERRRFKAYGESR